jgi:hypothetical protein
MLVQLPSSAEIRQARQYSNISYIVALHVMGQLRRRRALHSS